MISYKFNFLYNNIFKMEPGNLITHFEYAQQKALLNIFLVAKTRRCWCTFYFELSDRDLQFYTSFQWS